MSQWSAVRLTWVLPIASLVFASSANATQQVDLTVSAPATLAVSPSTQVPGRDITLSAYSVKNQGTLASSAFTIGYYLSSDATIDNTDRRLGGVSSGGYPGGWTSGYLAPIVTIPSDVTPGSYFIGILVDEASTTTDVNRSNNVKSTSLTVVAAADLVISAPPTLTVTPPSVVAGGTVGLPAFTVTNQGAAASPASTIGIYLSTDATITSADLILGYAFNSGLAIGASSTYGPYTLTIPATVPPGAYFIGVLADETNVVPETYEANNFLSTALAVTGQPDLAISPTALPTQPGLVPGATVTFPTLTITNQGAVASGTVAIGFYLSLDPVISTFDRRIGGITHAGIGAGAAATLTAQTAVIPTDVVAGSYFLGVLVDEGDAISESDETNNTTSGLFTVTPGADLLVWAPSALTVTPTTVNPGGTVTLPSFTVRNQGTLPVNAAIGFYLAPAPPITAAALRLGGIPSQAFAPGGAGVTFPSRTLTIPVSAPPGGQVIGILVDETNTAQETDEGNNSKWASLTVTGADLTVVAPTTFTMTPATVGAGGSVSVPQFTVKNVGTTPSKTPLTVAYYLSANATIAHGDVRLGAFPYTSPIAPSATTAFGPNTVTIPPGTAPGHYFLGVLLDDYETTPEMNEANNDKSGVLTVTAGPDLTISAPATLTVTPTTVVEGNGVAFPSCTITNVGTATSNAIRYAYYLSDDATITAADRLLVTVIPTPNTLPGGASTAACQAPVPVPVFIPAGSYYVGILVDPENATAESDETNNFKSTPLTVLAAPDLTITAPAPFTVTPASVPPGGTVAFPSWTVANQGSGASNSFSYGFYLSSDAAITAADLKLSVGATGALATATSRVMGGPTLAIPTTVAPGSYFIGILVDDANRTPESNEGNNFVSTALTVTQGPDLVIAAPPILAVSPASALPGDVVHIPNYTVQNQGTLPSSPVSVGYYLSPDATITAADRVLGHTSTAALAAGASVVLNGGVTIPADAASGSWFVGLLADDDNTTQESNEGNNYLSGPLTIPAVVYDGTATESPLGVALGGNLLVAGRIDVNQPSTAKRIGLFTKTPGAQVMVGLYSNAGALLASAPATATVSGKLDFPVPGSLLLPVGYYWLTVVANGPIAVGGQVDAAAVRRVAPYAFGAPLPSTFPSSFAAATGIKLDYFIETTVP